MTRASRRGIRCRGVVSVAVFLATLAGGWLGLFLPAGQAQPARGTARLGFLASASRERDVRRIEAFRQGLQALGWVEGRNLSIEYRFAGGQFDRLSALAAELVSLKPDVLVVAGSPAAHAAQRVTSVVPIVMTNAADPVGTGLAASLSRPGGNVTGLSDFNAGVVVKRLEILKEIVPAAARVVILLNPQNPTNPLQLKLLQEAAPAVGVRLLPIEIQRADDIEPAFVAMRKDAPDAVMILGDAMLGGQSRRLLDLTLKQRLPSTYATRDWSEMGGLMSYGPSFEDLYRRAATYVDKILRGTRPGDLPIEQPTKFDLAINLKTAHALGLTVPHSLLLRADRTIQ